MLITSKPEVLWNVYQNREYKEVKNLRDVRGYDTETKLNGDVGVLASSIEAIEPHSVSDCLQFLCTHDSENTIGFFFNIEFDVTGIIKFDKYLQRTMAEPENYGRAKYGDYQIHYIPRKMLRVTKGKHSWRFYDIAQFFGGSLESNAMRYLGHAPIAMKKKRENLFGCVSLPEIKRYCMEDSHLTERLARLLVQTSREWGIKTNKYMSTASVTETAMLKTCDIPRIKDMKSRAHALGYRAYRGGWFDSYQRGYFEKAWSYDIVSAFPAIMHDLPDVRDGQWDTDLDASCSLGMVACTITGNRDISILPLAVQPFGTNIYPIFDDPTTIVMTLTEYKKLKSIYDMEVLEAYSFKEKENPRRPFRKYIEDCFKRKAAYDENDFRRSFAKTLMNSGYGKFAQLSKGAPPIKAKNLTNFIYAAEITAGTRMQILDAIISNDAASSVIQILSDNIVCSKPLRVKMDKSLGAWDLKFGDCPFLSVMSGIYAHYDENKKDASDPLKDGWISHARGLDKKANLKQIIESGATSVKKRRPLHMKEAVAQGREDMTNSFLEFEREINPNNEVKRVWPKLDSLKDLLVRQYQSYPRSVSTLTPL